MNPLQKPCHPSSAIVGVSAGERRRLTSLAAISSDKVLRFFKGLWQGLTDAFMFADRFEICSSAFQLMFVKQSLLTFIFCFAVVIPSITEQVVAPNPQSGV
jgi:hypothetical protein